MPPPQSSEMARKDSGNPNEDQKILEKAAASAQFIPSSKKNVGMNPSEPVFTPRKGYSSFQDSGSSSTNTIYTPVNGSAMKLLNIGSTPDLPSTKASSPSPIKPIGSGSSTPSSHSSLKDGLPFSTDVDPNVAETRFVLFGMIPAEWLEGSILHEVLLAVGLVGMIDNCVAANGETKEWVSLYCRFDDLRAAQLSKAMFESGLTTASFRFVDHHEYFAHDFTHARAQAVSAYDGQVEFTATPRSMVDFNLHSIFDEVRSLANALGDVRSFAYIDSKGFQAPRFRAEYFSVKEAEAAIAMSVQQDAPFTSFQDTLTVSIKEYAPAGYVRYVHPAASGMTDLVAATEDLDASDDPNDRYHNYTTGHSRGDYTPRSRGDYVPRRFRGGYRGHGSRQPAWWIPSEDSPVHQTDMAFWKFNQPQTVNLQKIEAGIDVRTTIMLRNIPNRVDCEDLKAFLDATSEGHYDFSYLRIDFSNNLNVGYAFVNFVRPEFITNFVQRR
ncbi:hypothetical protein E4T48_07034, partial [Aureobasidium sp. EXF-10727]